MEQEEERWGLIKSRLLVNMGFKKLESYKKQPQPFLAGL